MPAGLTLGKSWKPAPPKPVDKEAENLKKMGITDPEEIKEYKDILLELRESKAKSKAEGEEKK